MAGEKELYDEYLSNLDQAHISAQKALNTLYEKGGPQRSLFVRMLLGRAQSILIGLYVQELGRQGEKGHRSI
jgi:hypothetical protein